jgi:dTDP-4-amino-4,6-dideoxygalactose transaminase
MASSPSKAEALAVVAIPPREPIAFIDLKAQQAAIRQKLDAAIARVLDHGQYIMGPQVAELEVALASFAGARYALSCSSGTDALLIAMMAKGDVGPGAAVLCPAFTYTATPETIALLGATPVFVDVDAATFNIDPAGLEAGLEAARGQNLRVVGLIAVDLFGQPADYDNIEAFARAQGIWVLADGAQSFGAVRRDRRVGTFGDVTATSFFPAKPLGCYGDGGAIFTDDQDLVDRMDSIRLHGKGTGVDKYDIVRIGINGRLDTLQAAILLEKLAIFPAEVAARQAIAVRYNEGLNGADNLTLPTVPDGVSSVWAQYTVRVLGHERTRVTKALQDRGVPTAVYYPRPLHHQQAYRHYPRAACLVNAEHLACCVFSLPMHANLTAHDQDYIIDQLRSVLV